MNIQQRAVRRRKRQPLPAWVEPSSARQAPLVQEQRYRASPYRQRGDVGWRLWALSISTSSSAGRQPPRLETRDVNASNAMTQLVSFAIARTLDATQLQMTRCQGDWNTAKNRAISEFSRHWRSLTQHMLLAGPGKATDVAGWAAEHASAGLGRRDVGQEVANSHVNSGLRTLLQLLWTVPRVVMVSD